MSWSPLSNLSQWRMRYRIIVSMLAHSALFALSLLFAFAFAYDFKFTEHNWFTNEYLTYLPLTLVVKLALFGKMGLYRDSWRYVGLRDLFSIVRASHFSILICITFYYVILWTGLITPARGYWVPSQVLLLDWLFTIAVVSGARISYRFYQEELRSLRSSKRKRLLMIGAGDAGDSILREIVRNSEDRYHVVGFLDDDPNKKNARIRGIEVLGTLNQIREVCESYDVDEVLIAIPSMPQKRVRSLIERCKGMNLQFRTVPAVKDLIEGKVQVSQIRPVDIEDLLGRDPVTLDTQSIGDYVHGKVVLVTGAGGSIGAEMCRQIARFEPKRLLLVEQMENALFEINRELQQSFKELDRVPYVADITDKKRMRHILNTEKPSAIFHAAAHKHVPMMEWNPGEAVKNNILGSRVMADVASESGVEKFVMISTDKAVNPTSVMGCSKRVAEMYVQQLASHTESKTEFVTVRFGNVLGSNGSVVPIFKEQIARGGPVTVTHPEMTRYFMTIPEAAQLVLQAGAMGQGGEIFLLDMGEPVKIVDLANDLITLSGLRPGEDIEVRFTGMRPGEKLFEELSITGEDVSRTSHSKIGIIKKRPEDFNRVCQGISDLLAIADDASVENIRKQLGSIVPEYQPGEMAKAVAAPAKKPAKQAEAEPATGSVSGQPNVRPA